MEKKINDLLEVIDKLETRINTFWNFFTVIVIANVGWLFASEINFNPTQKWALTLGLSVFFLANLLVLSAAVKRMVAFEHELNAVSKITIFETECLKNELSNDIMPGRLLSTFVLHLVVDIAVICLIWNVDKIS